jgi:hypothetical protein
MSKTLTTLSAFGATALLATTGLSQQQADAQRAGAVKDAGVYHVSTGTWTRGATTAFSTDTAYDNTANSGFFGNMGASMTWYDGGTLPGTNRPSAPMGCTDSYLVDGFQVAYCTYEGAAGTAMTYDFYASLASCTDPSGITATAAFSATGPGSSSVGAQACWIVTFDLAGTSLAFTMAAEADGVFDNSLALDNFGWGFGQTITAGTGGPLLRGDPNNAPFGDDTYYQNPGSSIGGTGLDNQDQFWLFDPSGATAAGCYWFGGYGPGTPWTGFHLELYADGGTCTTSGCTSYCSSNPNSAGAGAAITSTDGCDADGNGIVSMSASPVPNQPGIFFHGTNQLAAPFGCGLLCTAGTITRGGVVFASGNTASYDFDAAGAGITAGMGNFQYWFRDPAFSGTCGNVFNTSDAMIY